MKKIFFICLLFCFLASTCDEKKIKCLDCNNRDCVLEEAKKIAKKRLGNKIDNFEIKIEEDSAFYIIYYQNMQDNGNPLKLGGGDILIQVSKKDCKIVRFNIFI